jgi:hypothetical protein
MMHCRYDVDDWYGSDGARKRTFRLGFHGFVSGSDISARPSSDGVVSAEVVIEDFIGNGPPFLYTRIDPRAHRRSKPRSSSDVQIVFFFSVHRANTLRRGAFTRPNRTECSSVRRTRAAVSHFDGYLNVVERESTSRGLSWRESDISAGIATPLGERRRKKIDFGVGRRCARHRTREKKNVRSTWRRVNSAVRSNYSFRPNGPRRSCTLNAIGSKVFRNRTWTLCDVLIISNGTRRSVPRDRAENARDVDALTRARFETRSSPLHVPRGNARVLTVTFSRSFVRRVVVCCPSINTRVVHRIDRPTRSPGQPVLTRLRRALLAGQR